MARPKSLKPAYCRHPSGRAFVKLAGKVTYLGKHDTQESRDRYDVVVAEWIARGRQPMPSVSATANEPGAPSAGVTVGEVAAAFWQHAELKYVSADDGRPNAHLGHFRVALRVLCRLYRDRPAAEFGPLAMQVVRDEMLKPPAPEPDPETKVVRARKTWSRLYVNQQVGRIRRVFKWASANELVPATVTAALANVEGLRRGHRGARENERVKPVPVAYVEAAKNFLPEQLKAMIDLQLLTGMRPGEVCRMRGCDVDTDGDALVWIYRPPKHKTAHLDHERVIRIGPKAQEIVRRFLRPATTEYLFSPADVQRERLEAASKLRKTPLSCGNKAGTNRKAKPKKRPGERYTPHSYRARIVAACRRADAAERKRRGDDAKPDEVFVPDWHPHQLRHNHATVVRRDFGIEAARAILGHRSAGVTTIYAEVDDQKATDVIRKIG